MYVVNKLFTLTLFEIPNLLGIPEENILIARSAGKRKVLLKISLLHMH